MRILHTISSVNPIGGGPIEGVKRLGEVLVQAGHTIEVASMDAPDAAWVQAWQGHNTMPLHALGPSRGVFGYTPQWKKWLHEHASNFDAIFVEGLWQFHGVGTWQVLRSTTVPYFVFTHGMLDPWFKKAYPLKHLKKMIYWRLFENRVLHDAEGVCFTCEEERILARTAFRPYRVRERVMSYGTARPQIDLQKAGEQFRTQFNLPEKRILLFLGRIHPKKGCDLLIEAFAAIAQEEPELQLVMAGPDAVGWREKLEKRAHELKIEKRITWTGMLESEAKWGALQAAEVFILPSHQENFGVAVAEALCCGRPVLISNKVNIWREIQNDGAGIVADDTLQGTESLLRQWLKLNESERQTMRRHAMQCFDQHFEIQHVASILLQVVEEVVPDKKKSNSQ